MHLLSVMYVPLIFNQDYEMEMKFSGWFCQNTYCEIEEDLISIMCFTKDHEEGAAAFLEKRSPNFHGEDEFYQITLPLAYDLHD